jgi:hypothetical protein
MGRVSRAAVVALSVVAAFVSTGCSDEVAEPGPHDGASLVFTTRFTISIDEDAVAPNSLKVKVGEAIGVINNGTRAHGLTSGTIDTGTLLPGESTVVYLNEPGTINAYDRDAIDRKIEIEVAAEAS